jgi:predicted HAD superfamily phosphohydrolase YqeG
MLKTGGDIKFATLKAENLKGEVIEYDATYIAIHSKAEH